MLSTKYRYVCSVAHIASHASYYKACSTRHSCLCQNSTTWLPLAPTSAVGLELPAAAGGSRAPAAFDATKPPGPLQTVNGSTGLNCDSPAPTYGPHLIGH